MRKSILRTLTALAIVCFLLAAGGCDVQNPPPNTQLIGGIAIALPW
jgi:hypothetical protein